jgi:hypothetical protein
MLEQLDYPKPWPLFWAASALAIGYLAAALALRLRGWARGLRRGPAPAAAPGTIVRIWLAEVAAQRQIRQLSRLRWAAHLAICCGFLALGLLSATQVVLHALERLTPDSAIAAGALRGGGRLALKTWGNASGLVLLVGLVLALARRFVRRAEPAGETGESGTPLVLFLLWLTLSGFALAYVRLLAGARPAAAGALRPWLTALWTTHGFGGVALVAWLPRSGLLHAVLAPLVIALNARAEHARKDLYWPDTADVRASGSRKD